MVDNKLGQQLHDRATRGLPLNEEERAQLEAWYQAKDAEEDAWLAQLPPVPSIAEVQGRIERTLGKIGAVTRNINKVRRENEALRQEKDALYKQLLERASDTQKAA